ESAGIIDENIELGSLTSSNNPSSEFDTELVALAAHHLTSRKAEGQWLNSEVSRAVQRKAIRAVMTRNAPDESESVEAMRES
ncbi:MAG TPA: hypothetical protein PK402_11535, partial [Tepidisphaeraceae bacterium]|nr:hypothetical protein [Tepidisphaeraceae bacterium]